METSIIIRTKNEQRWLGVVLEKLKKQSYQDFEIIIIDSGSTDETLDIAKKYTKNIFHIKSEDFSYPYALNRGCKKANAQKYFVLLSAHSLPISNTWLQDGINHFSKQDIAGVYGGVWALSDGSVWEKLLFNEWLGKVGIILKKNRIITKDSMGVMGFTNAIVRKDLWEQYNFNEDFGMGGEDGDWVRHWLRKGLVFVREPLFSVYHSHGLGLRDLIRQYKHWKLVNKPQSFKKQTYRSNN